MVKREGRGGKGGGGGGGKPGGRWGGGRGGTPLRNGLGQYQAPFKQIRYIFTNDASW